MRAWRMCESVPWIDLHLSKEGSGSVVKEDAALVMRTMFGYVLAPMRVCSMEIQVRCVHMDVCMSPWQFCKHLKGREIFA